MYSTAIHPAFAVDYARARAVEAARHAEQLRRARAFRDDSTPRPVRRWHRLAWSPFGLRPVT